MRSPLVGRSSAPIDTAGRRPTVGAAPSSFDMLRMRATERFAVFAGGALNLEPPFLAERPERVVRDLPDMAVRVGETARVAAPERLAGRPETLCPGVDGPRHGRVDLRLRGKIPGEGHAGKTAALVGQPRILGERGAIEQGERDGAD